MGTSRRGHFHVVRIPSPKSVRKFYLATKAWMQANRHAPPALQQCGLDPRLRGFYQYFGYGTCLPVLSRVSAGNAAARGLSRMSVLGPGCVNCARPVLKRFAAQEKLAITARPRGRVLPTRFF